MDVIFDQVRAHVAIAADFDWTAGTVMGLLVDSGGGALWTPDPSDGFVANALASGIEAATPGDRPVVGGPVRNPSGHRVYYDSDPIVYGGVATGVAFDTFVLYNLVTDDSDSWLIGALDLGAQTGDGNDVVINPSSNGWLAW